MRAASRYTRDYFLKSRIKKILFWITAAAAAVLLALAYSYYFCQNIVVQESSMEPTLSAGDTILIDRVSYAFGSPKRGDIVVFRTSDDPKASLHIKRVIGLPGETVQIRDGQIYIDGEVYVEKKGFPSINNPGMAAEPVALGKGEYFVLGDNRNNSEDSRYVDIGVIESSRIVGKLWMVTAPFEKFGLLRS